MTQTPPIGSRAPVMQYRVKAFRTDTGIVTMHVDGTTADAVENDLRARGYHAISVSGADGVLIGRMRSRKRPFPLLVFCQELAALTGAGLSLIESIDALHARATDPHSTHVLGRLRTALREGRALSDAMSDMSTDFPELFIAAVRSTEETGDLNAALTRYINYRQTMDGLHDKIIAASIYPAMLLVVGGLVVIFLLGYVVPRFSQVFEGLGSDLPYLSVVLINWGQFASRHAPMLVVAFVALAAGTIYFLMRQETRTWLNEKAWTLPLIGEHVRIYQLARFTRTLAMLISGGIPLVAALGMVKHLLNQPVLRVSLDRATRAISEGVSVSSAFASHGLATDVGLKMIAVGERSGEMSRMLEELANFYDMENGRFIEWSTRLIEPLFMTAIGVVVGVIVLLMYFPIFELAGNLR